MKLIHLITLAILFVTFVFAQDANEDSIVIEIEDAVSDIVQDSVSDVVEDIVSDFVENDLDFMNDFVMLEAGSSDESFEIVQHDGDELIRRVKSKAGTATTEFYTVVHVVVTSSGDVEENYFSADEQLLNDFFASKIDALD